MQTTDASALLQIMQSPMGAALLPTMMNRENMVMDQSRATLQDTLARTQIAQNQDQRQAQMHPLDMESKRMGTEGQSLLNRGREFDLGVKEGLGQEHFQNKARQEMTERDQMIIERSGKQFREVAGVVKNLPEGPAGYRKAEAARLLNSVGLGRMVPSLQHIPDEKIGETLDAMAESMASMSEKAYLQSLKNIGARDTANIRAEGGRDVARIRANASIVEANIRSAVRASSDKLRAEGKGDDPRLSNVQGRLLAELNEAVKNNDEDRIREINETLKKWAESNQKPGSPPTVNIVDIERTPTGIRQTTRKVPEGNLQKNDSTEGWSAPQRIK